jgi:DNA modification methylase
MTPHYKDHRLSIYNGHALEVLRSVESESVQCCVTSPPYWGLRNYNVEGQIGLEETPELYTSRMVSVFHEVLRILKPNGTCWVNLGDSYASSWPCRRVSRIGNGSLPNGKRKQRPPRLGRLKEKDLVGIPWRVAFALQSDGWYLRSDIIWNKPNPMPESVTDRPTKAHEYIFLLSKSKKYFYDAEAIKEPFAESTLNDSRLDDPEYDVGRPERDFPGQASRGSGLLVPKCYRGSNFNQAIKMGRRFVGVELKSSYYQQAKLNLIAAESATERDLFKEAV